MAFDEQNEEANKALKECHLTLRFFSLQKNQNLLNLLKNISLKSSIEKLILDSLNSLFEEAKIILMKKFNPKDYETSYLRDSNGYIRKDAKM